MKGKNIITKVISMALAVAMCLSLCSAALAAELKDVTVKRSTGVKIYIVNYEAGENGTVKEVATRYIPMTAPTDGTAATEVVPFIVEDANGGGTTYLPLRAISNIYNVANSSIAWDNDTKTASLTNVTTGTNQTVTNPHPSTSTTTTYGTETTPAATGVTVLVNGTQYICKDANGNAVDSYLINGTTYFPLRALSVLFLGNLTADEMKSYIDFKADSTGENAVFIYNVASKATAQGDATQEIKDNPYGYIASLIKAYIADNFPTASALSEKFATFISQFGTGDNIRDFKDAILNGIETLSEDGLMALVKKVADEYGLSMEDMLQRLNYDNTKKFLTLQMSLKDYLATTDLGELNALIGEIFKNVTIADLLKALPKPSDIISGAITGMTDLPSKVMANISSLLKGGYIPTLSEITTAIKQVVSMTPNDSIIASVTAWAKARTIGLDDIMEVMGVKSLSDLAKVIKDDASAVVSTSIAGQMQQTIKNVLFGSDNTNKTIIGAAVSTTISDLAGLLFGKKN